VGHDVLIGHVGPAVHPHGGELGIPGRELQSLVGDEDGRKAQALSRAEDQLLDVARGGVRIDPDLQEALPSGSVAEAAAGTSGITP
jgi:hypothetical protein